MIRNEVWLIKYCCSVRLHKPRVLAFQRAAFIKSCIHLSVINAVLILMQRFASLPFWKSQLEIMLASGRKAETEGSTSKYWIGVVLPLYFWYIFFVGCLLETVLSAGSSPNGGEATAGKTLAFFLSDIYIHDKLCSRPAFGVQGQPEFSTKSSMHEQAGQGWKRKRSEEDSQQVWTQHPELSCNLSDVWNEEEWKKISCRLAFDF